MKFSSLVEHVTKKPIPAHVTHFVVEVMATDVDGEDVEVYIRDRCLVLLMLNLSTAQVPFIVVRK